jgi:urocanate hydratase
MGPFRWIAVSGDPKDIHTIDDIILANFSRNHPIVPWIEKAREHVQFTGLPARIGWLGYGERSRLGLLVNEAVADGGISGPIAFTRDHLDSGSAAMPHRETENMRDGSDAIADWPMLNALLNCASGADLVAIHGLGSRGVSAGVTIVADGTPSAAERLKRVLDNDPGIGVLRHADAGYQTAIEQAGKTGYAPAAGLEEQRSP